MTAPIPQIMSFPLGSIDVDGRLRYEHGGETNGAYAQVAYFPDAGLAVAGIANYNFWGQTLGEPAFFALVLARNLLEARIRVFRARDQGDRTQQTGWQQRISFGINTTPCGPGHSFRGRPCFPLDQPFRPFFSPGSIRLGNCRTSAFRR